MNATNTLPSTNGNTYATQAGTAAQVGTGTLGANSSNSSTGFGPDDFPALGQSQELHSAGAHSLNGSATTAQDLAAQHRQNLLGSLPTAQQRATPSSEAQQRVHLPIWPLQIRGTNFPLLATRSAVPESNAERLFAKGSKEHQFYPNAEPIRKLESCLLEYEKA